MENFVRVNMSNGTVAQDTLPDKYRTFGNRGLVAKVLTEEVEPACDPLAEGNKLVFALGMLAGTGFPTGNRLSVGAKSPLTGGIKEANSGGNIGTLLARHAIKLIIVEGKPSGKGAYVLWIQADGQPKLIKADDYTGLGAYALVEKLKSV